MSLFLSYRDGKSQNVVRLGAIKPGEYGDIADYSGEQVRRIGFYCLPSDTGAETYIFTANVLEAQGVTDSIPANLFENKEPEIVLGRGEQKEIGIKTATNYSGSLIVRHMTTAANVPTQRAHKQMQARQAHEQST